MIKTILKAVATGIIDEHQAEKIYEFWKNEQLPKAWANECLLTEDEFKEQQHQPKESALDRMMRECYGCMGKLDIEEDGCVEYHDGKGWHATISLNEPECLCSIGRSDIMVSFEDNLIKYGLKKPKGKEPEKVRAN